MGFKLKQPIFLKELLSKNNLNYFEVEDFLITNIAPFDELNEGSFSFTKTTPNIAFDSCAFASIKPENNNENKCRYIVSKNPRLDFIKILDYLVKNIGFSHFDFDSEIHPSVIMGQNVVVERGCKIAENVVLEHNVVIQSGTTIGKNSRIRVNSSIGGDGFGFERLEDGSPIRFQHLGGVEIGEDVEIGSLNSVMRGTLSSTIVQNNVKTDNLVHIAHNCFIGKGTFITACAEFSGGVIVGKNVWIGPNSSLMQKIHIGDNALIGLGAVVTKDVPAGKIYAGNPARYIKDV